MYSSFKNTIFTFIFAIISLASFGQTGVLKGTLTDSKTKEALIGATIRLEGLTLGASSNVEGNFEIAKIPAGIYKVIITSVGYQPNQISHW